MYNYIVKHYKNEALKFENNDVYYEECNKYKIIYVKNYRCDCKMVYNYNDVHYCIVSKSYDCCTNCSI
jgi:hypothetical protein